MTDLEAHINRPGRKELVKQVRAKIKELGVTYIYYQFVSVTGRIVGKGIPADHWESVAERGFQLVYGSTANLFVDRHRNYIGYGPEASELVGIPDPETFVQLPWDKRRPRILHLLPQPRGRVNRRPSRRIAAEICICTRSSRTSTRACICATAANRK
jgi:glutamine synthetase